MKWIVLTIMGVYGMYADVLMLINFLFNFYILYLTAFLTRSGPSSLRIALGAFTGSLFSLSLLLQVPISFIWKALFTVVMVAVVFWPFTLLQGLKLIGTVYAVTLLTGGALFSFLYLISPQPFVVGSNLFLVPSPTFLPYFLALILVVFLARFIWLGLTDNHRLQSFEGEVTVRSGGQEKTISALVDTGNRMREPVSGTPVIIVHYKEMGTILGGLHSLKEDAAEGILLQLTNHLAKILEAGIYLIPYKSLGSKGDFLPGFKPEEVVVSVGENHKTWSNGQVIVCLTPHKVSRNSSFLALVNPDLIF